MISKPKNCVSHIGQVFREIRKSNNYTQDEFSDELKISKAQLCRIEQGQIPTEKTLKKLLEKGLAKEEDVFEFDLKETTLEIGRIIETLNPRYQEDIRLIFRGIKEFLKDRKQGETITIKTEFWGEKRMLEF